jgi:hypothetical protein
MSPDKMSEEISLNRRRFLGTAAMTIAAAEFGMIGSLEAQSSNAKPANVPQIKPGTNASFGPLKHVNAGVLSIAYAEAGPADAPPGAAFPQLALRYSQLRRCRSYTRSGWLPCSRAIFAGLRRNAVSLRRYAAQRSASRSRSRCHQLHGCTQDR